MERLPMAWCRRDDGNGSDGWMMTMRSAVLRGLDAQAEAILRKAMVHQHGDGGPEDEDGSSTSIAPRAVRRMMTVPPQRSIDTAPTTTMDDPPPPPILTMNDKFLQKLDALAADELLQVSGTHHDHHDDEPTDAVDDADNGGHRGMPPPDVLGGGAEGRSPRRLRDLVSSNRREGAADDDEPAAGDHPQQEGCHHDEDKGEAVVAAREDGDAEAESPPDKRSPDPHAPTTRTNNRSLEVQYLRAVNAAYDELLSTTGGGSGHRPSAHLRGALLHRKVAVGENAGEGGSSPRRSGVGGASRRKPSQQQQQQPRRQTSQRAANVDHPQPFVVDPTPPQSALRAGELFDGPRQPSTEDEWLQCLEAVERKLDEGISARANPARWPLGFPPP